MTLSMEKLFRVDTVKGESRSLVWGIDGLAIAEYTGKGHRERAVQRGNLLRAMFIRGMASTNREHHPLTAFKSRPNGPATFEEFVHWSSQPLTKKARSIKPPSVKNRQLHEAFMRGREFGESWDRDGSNPSRDNVTQVWLQIA